jgi:O-antigen/teichoic acid export membrane protein
MGPQYAELSETVLQILMISLFFSMADSTAGAIFMAIEKHKPVARWAVYEAVLNFGLSIVLAKLYGLYGVAWGTSVSMALTHLAFYPRYVESVLKVPMWTYLWEGWGKIALCSLPFALVCAVTERFWHARNLFVFFAQIVAILPVYGLCVLAVFRQDARTILVKWQAA